MAEDYLSAAELSGGAPTDGASTVDTPPADSGYLSAAELSGASTDGGGYLSAAELSGGAPPKSPDGPLAFSVDKAQELFGRGVKTVEDTFGAKTGYGESIIAQQQADIKAGGYKPQYQGNLVDQKSIGDAAGWLWEKLQETSVSSAPMLLGSAAAVATSAVSIPAALAVTGATWALSGLINTGDVAGEMTDLGVYDAPTALVGGFFVTLLDRVGAGKVVPASALRKLIGAGVKKKVAESLVKDAAKTGVTRELAKRAFAEGVTETLQDGVNVIAATSQGASYDPKALGKRAIDTFVLGAGMGGAISGPVMAIEGIRAPRDAQSNETNSLLKKDDLASAVSDNMLQKGYEEQNRLILKSRGWTDRQIDYLSPVKAAQLVEQNDPGADAEAQDATDAIRLREKSREQDTVRAGKEAQYREDQAVAAITKRIKEDPYTLVEKVLGTTKDQIPNADVLERLVAAAQKQRAAEVPGTPRVVEEPGRAGGGVTNASGVFDPTAAPLNRGQRTGYTGVNEATGRPQAPTDSLRTKAADTLIASGGSERPFVGKFESGRTPEQQQAFVQQAEQKTQAERTRLEEDLQAKWDARARDETSRKYQNEQTRANAEAGYAGEYVSDPGNPATDGFYHVNGDGVLTDAAGNIVQFSNHKKAAAWAASQKQGAYFDRVIARTNSNTIWLRARPAYYAAKEAGVKAAEAGAARDARRASEPPRGLPQPQTFENAQNGIFKMEPGSVVTRKQIQELGGVKSARQVKALMDQLVAQGVIEKSGTRWVTPGVSKTGDGRVTASDARAYLEKSGMTPQEAVTRVKAVKGVAKTAGGAWLYNMADLVPVVTQEATPSAPGVKPPLGPDVTPAVGATVVPKPAPVMEGKWVAKKESQRSWGKITNHRFDVTSPTGQNIHVSVPSPNANPLSGGEIRIAAIVQAKASLPKPPQGPDAALLNIPDFLKRKPGDAAVAPAPVAPKEQIVSPERKKRKGNTDALKKARFDKAKDNIYVLADERGVKLTEDQLKELATKHLDQKTPIADLIPVAIPTISTVKNLEDAIKQLADVQKQLETSKKGWSKTVIWERPSGKTTYTFSAGGDPTRVATLIQQLKDVPPSSKFQQGEGSPTLWAAREVAPDARVEVHPANDALRKDVQRQLNRLVRRIAGKGTRVEVVDRMEGKDPVTGEWGAVTGGLVRGGDNTVYVSLDSLDALGTGRHEMIHFLKETKALGGARWKILERQAKNWAKVLKIGERYDHLSKDARVEEIIAEAATANGQGRLVAKGVAGKTLQFIREFGEKLRNLVTSGKFLAARQILDNIEVGGLATEITGAAKGGGENTQFQRATQATTVALEQAMGKKLKDLTGAERITLEQAMQGDIHPGLKPEIVAAVKAMRKDGVTLDDVQTSRLRGVIERIVKTGPIKKLRYNFIDSFSDLQDLVGTQVAEGSDPILKKTLFPGIARDRVDRFEYKYYEPLIALITDSGEPLVEAEKWLQARHAKEANADLEAKNPDRKDNKSLSGMTNAEAEVILRKHKNNPTFQTMGVLVDSLTSETLNNFEESGVESKATLDAWRKAFKHYVPLHRDEMLGTTQGTGGGFSTAVRASKLRAGSVKEVTNIIPHLLQQHKRSIILAAKAEVGKAMLSYAKQNPNSDFYSVVSVPKTAVLKTNPEYKALLEERRALVANQTLSDSEKEVALDSLSAKMESTRRKIIGVTADPFYARRDNVFVVKIDGEPQYIEFNKENPAALRIADALKNRTSGEMNTVLRITATINSWLSQVNTMMNPEFVITNFARDIQTAIYNINDTEAKGLARKVINPKRMGGAVLGIRQYLIHKKRTGEWEQWFDRYRKAGAQIGWIDNYRDVWDQRSKVVDDLKDLAGNPWAMTKHRASRLYHWIEKNNLAVENAVRLGAFRAAVESGVSESKAAKLARELTVDFNRKGAQSTVANSLYLFFNAGVQGNARMLRALARSRKVQGMAVATVAFAAGLDMVNRSLGGNDDDGIPFYDKIPDYIKDRNLVFMPRVFGVDSSQPIKIPLPWGYNIFHVIGQAIGTSIQKPNSKISGQALRVASAAIDAFNPLGSNGSIAQFLAPTVVDPLIQISENKTFSGRALMPEDRFGIVTPDHMKFWKSTNPLAKSITKKVAELTGGDAVRSGAIDISPATLELWVSTITGGIGRTAADTVGTIVRLVGDEETTVTRIPFLRRVYGTDYDRATQSLFYERLDEVKTFERQLKMYRGTLRGVMLRREKKQLVPLLGPAKMSERRLKIVNKRIRFTAARPISDAQKETQLKTLISRKQNIYRMFLRRTVRPN